MFWLAEDDCTIAQGAASRNVEGRLDVYLRLCGLQPGAHAKPDGRRVSSAVSLGRSVSEWSRNAHKGRSAAQENRLALRNSKNENRNCLPCTIFQQPASELNLSANNAHLPLFRPTLSTRDRGGVLQDPP